MTETLLQIRSHEVWRALEVIDPVAVLAEDLIGRAVGRAGHGHRVPARLVPWHGSGHNGTEQVLLDHPDCPVPCVLPAQCVRNSHAAALAAVAARELLVSGGVTVAMLGAAETTQPQLSVVARHVPDISHVALCLEPADGTELVEPRLVDQLELSGIGLSVMPTLADTVFGANLVIATSQGGARQDLSGLRPGQLARGTVLVNATGKDLPTGLVDQVGQVYVDDLGLIEAHRERHVVANHLAAAPVTGVPAPPRITADLPQLLTTRQGGHPRGDDIVLVELLGAHELNAELAYRICEGAVRSGLGVRIAAG